MHHVSNCFENYTLKGLEFLPKMPQWAHLLEIIKQNCQEYFLSWLFGPQTLGPPRQPSAPELDL